MTRRAARATRVGACLARSAAVAAGLAACLAACGGDVSDALALGTAADIDYYPVDGSSRSDGSGAVTVTDVRKGSTAELEEHGYSLDPDEKSSEVYYVDVTFENDSDGAVAPRGPSGEDTDENLISALTVIDLGGPAFETCAGVPDEIPAGTTVEACSILLVPEGVQLDRISYFPGGTADFVYWETGL
jgi:hypothetical protein